MPSHHADLSISVTSFAATPDVDLTGSTGTQPRPNFTPDEFFLTVESASVVAFSFDGANDHGRLKGDAAPLYFTHQRETRAQRIWFRVVSGVNPAVVRASSWTHV